MVSNAVIIRVLQSDDHHLFESIAAGVFDSPIDRRWMTEFLADPRHHMVVAIVADQIVGMASAVHYVHPDKPPELWVNEVGVSDLHQNRGIGKLLMRALLDVGRSLGCTEAWVLTEPENSPARHLYASVGGQEQSTVYVTFRLDQDTASSLHKPIRPPESPV